MKRCMICDAEPTIAKAFGWYHVGCEECEISTRLHAEKQDAINAWNFLVDDMINDFMEISEGYEE